ncbi:glycosyltransferase family 2 protein [Lichenicola sp.]|uniref:glycosyltransferase family 2 protein n=1 Tax=Lichenicola sp. TaxID=2804529 RepID=UPI003B000EAA
MSGFLHTYAEAGFDLQAPMAAAVIMPTTLRSSIVEALRSIFRQTLQAPIHVLIGIDQALGDLELIEQACRGRPPHVVVQVLDPGYSTSVRHGGLHPARDGGVLRCVLSYLANSPYVAYLDDDNWWAPEHLAQLLGVLQASDAAYDYAYSYRMFVHPRSLRPICIDEWESVGVGRGVFKAARNGFVDPNCLMLDKRRCADALPAWTMPLPGDTKAMSADRMVFDMLQRHHAGASTGQASCYYRLDPTDGLQAMRMSLFGAKYDQAALFGDHGDGA